MKDKMIGYVKDDEVKCNLCDEVKDGGEVVYLEKSTGFFAACPDCHSDDIYLLKAADE